MPGNMFACENDCWDSRSHDSVGCSAGCIAGEQLVVRFSMAGEPTLGLRDREMPESVMGVDDLEEWLDGDEECWKCVGRGDVVTALAALRSICP